MRRQHAPFLAHVRGRQRSRRLHLDAGEHGRRAWDGGRDDGGVAGAGLYFARLLAAGASFTRPVVKLQ